MAGIERNSNLYSCGSYSFNCEVRLHFTLWWKEDMLNVQVNWRSLSGYSLVLVLIVSGIPAARLLHSRLQAMHVRTGQPIPYTSILRETVRRSDGTTTVAKIVSDATWAVRSDGSTVLRIVHKIGNQETNRIISLTSGVKVTVDELAETKSTAVLKNPNPASWQRDPNSKCINSFAGTGMTSVPEVIIAEESVKEYRAVKISSSGNNMTTWYALDYGCAMVKQRMVFNDKESSEHELIALIPGEPEAALFMCPFMPGKWLHCTANGFVAICPSSVQLPLNLMEHGYTDKRLLPRYSFILPFLSKSILYRPYLEPIGSETILEWFLRTYQLKNPSLRLHILVSSVNEADDDVISAAAEVAQVNVLKVVAHTRLQALTGAARLIKSSAIAVISLGYGFGPSDLLERAFRDHAKENNDFTYVTGFPDDCSPEIYSTEVIRLLGRIKFPFVPSTPRDALAYVCSFSDFQQGMYRPRRFANRLAQKSVTPPNRLRCYPVPFYTI